MNSGSTQKFLVSDSRLQYVDRSGDQNGSKMKEDSKVSLEKALEETGFGRFNYSLIVLTGAFLGCVFLETVGINVKIYQIQFKYYSLHVV